MKSVDALLDKRYDKIHYHCVHFVIEAAYFLLGYDYLKSFISESMFENVRQNTLIKNPKIGCIVTMRNLVGNSHVGLYYDDKVLHITENGVRLESLQSLSRSYRRIKFYAPNYI